MTMLKTAVSASTGYAQRFGAVVSLVLLSQVLSAASTVVLPVLGLSTADMYAAATQVGIAGLSGVVIGIVYNLAIGRPGFRQWRRWSIAAAAFSIALSLGQYGLLSRHDFFGGFDHGEGLTILVAFGVGGAALSAAGIIAVRHACLGRPRTLAGITVAPNAGLLVAVLSMAAVKDHVPPVVTHVVPAISWALASFVMLLVLARSARDSLASPDAVSAFGSGSLQATALAVGVITSSVVPAFYVAAVAGLATGTAYALVLTSKLGNSAVSLGVNSVLVVQYNWVDESKVSTRAPIRFAVVGLASAATSLMLHELGEPVVAYVFAALTWLSLMVPSAIVVREVNRQRLSGVLTTKVALDLVAAISAAAWLMLHPTVTGYFGAFIASAAVTIGVGARGLRSRSLAYLGALSLVVAVVFLVRGW